MSAARWGAAVVTLLVGCGEGADDPGRRRSARPTRRPGRRETRAISLRAGLPATRTAGTSSLPTVPRDRTTTRRASERGDAMRVTVLKAALAALLIAAASGACAQQGTAGVPRTTGPTEAAPAPTSAPAPAQIQALPSDGSAAIALPGHDDDDHDHPRGARAAADRHQRAASAQQPLQRAVGAASASRAARRAPSSRARRARRVIQPITKFASWPWRPGRLGALAPWPWPWPWPWPASQLSQPNSRPPSDRQQQELAERHHQAGDREDAEGDRIGPVRGALEVGEALDHAAGVAARARRSAPWPSSRARARRRR